jgi:ribosomal protein S18 acetylase RimI-like enzyme
VSGEVEIFRAVPDDADALTRIAFAAKSYWGYPERWIEQWQKALTITPEFITDNEVYAAVFEEEMGGFYALVERGSEVELEHLWVSPKHMGAGIGRALLDHAVRRTATLGAKTLSIEADPNAEGFYRRMGARRVGENVYEIEGHRRELPLLILDVSNLLRAV